MANRFPLLGLPVAAAPLLCLTARTDHRRPAHEGAAFPVRHGQLTIRELLTRLTRA